MHKSSIIKPYKRVSKRTKVKGVCATIDNINEVNGGRPDEDL
jgi:hypothetical protein